MMIEKELLKFFQVAHSQGYFGKADISIFVCALHNKPPNLESVFSCPLLLFPLPILV